MKRDLSNINCIKQMKTNSDAPQTLYLGLDVHKAETVIAPSLIPTKSGDRVVSRNWNR